MTGLVVAVVAVTVAVWCVQRPVGLLVLPGDEAEEPAAGRERPTSLAQDLRRRRAARREAARARSELPHLVGLVAVGVEAGAPVPSAVRHACDALGGASAERLREVALGVERGGDPVRAWTALTHDESLAPLGRALGRSARTGSSVVDTLALLAVDLADQARAAQEDAARTVGVKAAVPLGLCLLPAFLLLGVVPLVAGLAAQLTFG